MKKLLSFCLMLVLSISVMAMSGCFGGGSSIGGLFGGSEFEKMFDDVQENCTMRSVGNNTASTAPNYMKYKFTENKVELTTAIGTKWWDATDTSDYVLLERSYETNYNLTVRHKSKNEYQTARNDSFDLLFGYMAKHEDKFTKTEAGNYKTTPGDPVVHTVGGTQIQYDDVIIYVEDGKIVWAEFALILMGDIVEIEVEVGNTEITLPSYSRD